MAFRRSVTARAKNLYQQPRVAVPFSHIDRDDSDRENTRRHDPIYKGSGIPDYLRRRRPSVAGDSAGSFCGSRNVLQDRRFAIPAAFAPVYVRNMSTFGEGSGAEKVEIVTDVVAQAAPVANEVAVAAADSLLPVASLQYVIDYVHSFTGLDWWASIVLTTILIRTLTLPLTIHRVKVSSNYTLMKPRALEILEEVMNRDMSPAAVAFGQDRMMNLLNEYGITPFSHIKGGLNRLIVAPVFCCFFLAINNMAEKVQSFKHGGALWFTDLSTPDATYILPVLMALIIWIALELNAQEGFESNPPSKTIMNVSRAFVALTIPLTACFTKAIFFYWITSNLYTLAFGLAIKKPEVKKMLGIPKLPPPPPPSDSEKPPLSFSESLTKHADVVKKYAAALQKLRQLQSSPQPSFFESLKKHSAAQQQQQRQLQSSLQTSQQSLPPPPQQSISPPSVEEKGQINP